MLLPQHGFLVSTCPPGSSRMAEQYLQKFREVHDYFTPVTVTIEAVAAQEYLARDAEM